MIQTGRDPFARQTVTKRQTEGDCDFCGGCNKRGKVWIYSVDPDSVSPRDHDIPGQFCSIGCLRAYYGE